MRNTSTKLKYYRFERAEKLCKYFNKICKHVKEKKENKRGKLPICWTLVMIEKYMTGWEILKKYIDLENLCLTKEEKKEVMGNVVQIGEKHLV